MKFILSLLLLSISFSQISMNYFIRQDSVYIGDIVNYVIELKTSSNQVPIFPEINSESDMMSVHGKRIGNNFVEYDISFWETGIATIPMIPIQIMENNQLKLTLETDSLQVQIFSLLNAEEMSIRGLKGMKNIEMISPFEKGLIIFCIILGVLIAIYIWRKRERKNKLKRKKYKFVEPIHIRIQKSLENLEIPFPINWENAEKYYLNLTYLFREYLGEKFYFRALEMTTKEIIEFIQNKNIIEYDICIELEELLNRADLSKYAKQIPEKDFFISDKNKAIKLVKLFHEINNEFTKKEK
jgi:hypothetical protein